MSKNDWTHHLPHFTHMLSHNEQAKKTVQATVVMVGAAAPAILIAAAPVAVAGAVIYSIWRLFNK